MNKSDGWHKLPYQKRKKKGRKPFHIEGRFMKSPVLCMPGFGPMWEDWGSYHTAKSAQDAVDTFNRKYLSWGGEFRLKGESA